MSRAETLRRPDPQGELEVGLAASPSLRLTLKSEPGHEPSVHPLPLHQGDPDMSRPSTLSRSTKETRT